MPRVQRIEDGKSFRNEDGTSPTAPPDTACCCDGAPCCVGECITVDLTNWPPDLSPQRPGPTEGLWRLALEQPIFYALPYCTYGITCRTFFEWQYTEDPDVTLRILEIRMEARVSLVADTIRMVRFYWRVVAHNGLTWVILEHTVSPTEIAPIEADESGCLASLTYVDDDAQLVLEQDPECIADGHACVLETCSACCTTSFCMNAELTLPEYPGLPDRYGWTVTMGLLRRSGCTFFGEPCITGEVDPPSAPAWGSTVIARGYINCYYDAITDTYAHMLWFGALVFYGSGTGGVPGIGMIEGAQLLDECGDSVTYDVAVFDPGGWQYTGSEGTVTLSVSETCGESDCEPDDGPDDLGVLAYRCAEEPNDGETYWMTWANRLGVADSFSYNEQCFYWGVALIPHQEPWIELTPGEITEGTGCEDCLQCTVNCIDCDDCDPYCPDDPPVCQIEWSMPGNGECGTCIATVTGDGCGWCCICDGLCDCPQFPVPGGPFCPCDAAPGGGEDCDTETHTWWCDPDCIYEGSLSSPCSRIGDTGGIVDLPLINQTATTMEFEGDFTADGRPLKINCLFDCVAKTYVFTCNVSYLGDHDRCHGEATGTGTCDAMTSGSGEIEIEFTDTILNTECVNSGNGVIIRDVAIIRDTECPA